jgi:hypothetical protein
LRRADFFAQNLLLKNPARLGVHLVGLHRTLGNQKKPPIQAGRLLDLITVAGARNPPDSDLVDRVACRVVFRPDPGGAGCLDQRPVMILPLLRAIGPLLYSSPNR